MSLAVNLSSVTNVRIFTGTRWVPPFYISRFLESREFRTPTGTIFLQPVRLQLFLEPVRFHTFLGTSKVPDYSSTQLYSTL